MNSGIDLRRERVRYSISLPVQDVEPNRAWMCDIESISWEELTFQLEDGRIGFDVNSNWFMVAFSAEGAPPIAHIDMPMTVSRGSTIQITTTTLGGPSGTKIEGEIFAPALELTNENITIPGRFEARVPESMPAGMYQVRLESDTCLGCKRFIEVK